MADTLRFLWALCDLLAHALVQRDEGERQLSAVVVRGGDDAHVRDVRVVEQVALQLRGRDLESADLDQLLRNGTLVVSTVRL